MIAMTLTQEKKHTIINAAANTERIKMKNRLKESERPMKLFQEENLSLWKATRNNKKESHSAKGISVN